MKRQDTKNIPEKEAEESQKRLLDAAEELYAQKGLDATSIRDITTKAERNLASVNYFFGNKQELYEELFRRRLREMRDTRLAGIKTAMSGRSKPTLEKLIRAYAVAFLEPFKDPQRSRRFMKLFARELVEQRLPKNMFLEEMAAPVMTAFEEAVIAICPNIDKRDVQKSIHSIVGQLVHVMHIKTMFEGEQGAIATFDIDETIEHIVKFSAAGIRAFAKGNEK
ncbi:MAG: TetR/AcrR family transcriptional regulator [Planctomycetota bacterium]